MEKREAVREWCIVQAISLKHLRSESYATKDVITDAKKLEEYITGHIPSEAPKQTK